MSTLSLLLCDTVLWWIFSCGEIWTLHSGAIIPLMQSGDVCCICNQWFIVHNQHKWVFTVYQLNSVWWWSVDELCKINISFTSYLLPPSLPPPLPPLSFPPPLPSFPFSSPFLLPSFPSSPASPFLGSTPPLSPVLVLQELVQWNSESCHTHKYPTKPLFYLFSC